ncbi:Protein KTI12-like protein, partial [Cucurbita argyrosperma subsp. sororia]
MALVVVCGQPCSGKSTAALCLAEALKESNVKQAVKIINETSFHLDRNQSYADMPAEKNLRGVLRSEVDRSVSEDNIVIVDSLNSIKGYRYELWCLARGAGIRYCVLYCDVEEIHCRKWNDERRENGEANYDDKIFEDLVRSGRLEVEGCKDLTANDRDSEYSIIGGNSLYELDKATHEVVNAIVEAQGQAMGGPLNGVPLGQDLPTINISKSVGLPELRRLRRTFIKLTGQTSLSGPPPPCDAASAKRMFVDYLNRELGTA